MEYFSDFIRKAIPDLHHILFYSPFLILYIYICSWICGYLKTTKNLKTAYTRKIFHLLIFLSATVLQIMFGLKVVVLFGSIVFVFVLLTTYLGEGFAFFEALARPKDIPHQKVYIVIPLITTALGGVISNLLFGQFAIVGYLVGGFGDAVGEPVGAAWGKHPYKVTSITGISANRTYEGSFAVFLAGAAAAFFGLSFFEIPVYYKIITALACSLVSTITEAFSSHGTDNLTIQIVASWSAQVMVSLLS